MLAKSKAVSRLLLRMTAPSFVGGVTEGFQRAVDAARFAGNADLAPVMDHFVGELDPVVARDDLHQLLLDFLGFFGFCEAKAFGEAKYVRVDDDAFGEAVCNSKDDVAGFAGDSGEGEQFGNGFWHFAVEVSDEFLGSAGD